MLTPFPRWLKALRDLGLYQLRATLVVIAVAIGVFGVGMVTDAYAILLREMDRNYAGTNPAAAVLWVDGADDRLVADLRARPNVADVERRRTVVARVEVSPDDWRPLWLYVVEDFDNVRIDRFTPERGQYPPARGEIAIERAALSVARTKVGEIGRASCRERV